MDKITFCNNEYVDLIKMDELLTILEPAKVECTSNGWTELWALKVDTSVTALFFVEFYQCRLHNWPYSKRLVDD